MSYKRFLFVSCVLLQVIALPALAQWGEWQAGPRVVWLQLDAVSDPVVNVGSRLELEQSVALGGDVSRMLGESFGLELMLAVAELDISAGGGLYDGRRVGSIMSATTCFSFEYHFPLADRLQPYVGAGIAYTTLFGFDESLQIGGSGLADISSSGSLGPEAYIGVDFDTNNRWYVNLELRYLEVELDLDLERANGSVIDSVGLTESPWLLSLGAGYRF
jgi:outer membrane protein